MLRQVQSITLVLLTVFATQRSMRGADAPSFKSHMLFLTTGEQGDKKQEKAWEVQKFEYAANNKIFYQPSRSCTLLINALGKTPLKGQVLIYEHIVEYWGSKKVKASTFLMHNTISIAPSAGEKSLYTAAAFATSPSILVEKISQGAIEGSNRVVTPYMVEFLALAPRGNILAFWVKNRIYVRATDEILSGKATVIRKKEGLCLEKNAQCNHLSISPCGAYLFCGTQNKQYVVKISAFDGKKVKLSDERVLDKEFLTQGYSPFYAVAWSALGGQLFAQRESGSREIDRWDVAAETSTKDAPLVARTLRFKGPIRAFALASQKNYMATLSYNEESIVNYCDESIPGIRVSLYPIKALKALEARSLPKALAFCNIPLDDGLGNSVFSLSLSPDGRTIFYSADEGESSFKSSFTQLQYIKKGSMALIDSSLTLPMNKRCYVQAFIGNASLALIPVVDTRLLPEQEFEEEDWELV